jgi:hypothetical protein
MVRKAVSCLLLLLSLSLAPVARAQSPTATLSGSVVDSRGDAIKDATVEAVHVSTGDKRVTATNGEGAFVLPGLPVGSYKVTVQASNFASKRYEEVVLVVGQIAKLDVELGVTNPNEVVDVDDVQAPLIQTTTSIVEGVIKEREIEALPLNGRNFLELALLIPGNAPGPNFDPTKTESVSISSAGHIGRGGTYTVDGADNSDDVVGGSLQNISQEAVKEFQIATSRYSAETGRSGSSVINIVTKSGTNDIHGSASFFWRDDSLQGLPATAVRSTGDVPFDREHYALAVGGPFVEDSAWWFGNFEYRNQDGVVPVGTRDLASRTITRSFVEAPLDDLLANFRADWRVSEDHRLAFRYSFENSDATSASTLIRPIGSASQRQSSENQYHSFLADWQWALSERWYNSLIFAVNNFSNDIDPVTAAPQLTFPSLQDGASFRVPQATRQNRIQISDTVSALAGNHSLRFGGTLQRVDGDFDLDVFREGRIEYVEDFPAFDRNGDGAVNDDDLLFAVTLRSGKPDQTLIIHDADNWHGAFFFQDDWRVHPRLTLNLGVRYEVDSDVKNVRRYDEINPIVRPFLSGSRSVDKNNFGPRLGFNWSTEDGDTSVHGGYGIYYDRITIEIQSLERGLDGRALPVEVRAGNVFFIDPNTGGFPPFAPTSSNPFTGFILPGAGASGINIIDDNMQNPEVQQFNLGVQHQMGDFALSVDYLHTLGTHFIIGRTIGAVFNPVVGGPDRVVNLESSVNHKYDGLLVTFEKRYSDRYQFRASYTLSKAFNYANDDQIPFSQGPIDPNNLQLEYGPTPMDQRHRFVFSGAVDAPWGIKVSAIMTAASGVPMDILLPDGLTRIPILQRNAGGRLFHTGADLNAFIQTVNAGGGIGGAPLPFVRDDARFNDSFHSLDLRFAKSFEVTESVRVEPLVEVFNVFNITNILGPSLVNYTGRVSTLVRDSNDPNDPGFLRSSAFGAPVTTAGTVFGSGGPRAFQLGVRLTF